MAILPILDLDAVLLAESLDGLPLAWESIAFDLSLARYSEVAESLHVPAT